MRAVRAAWALLCIAVPLAAQSYTVESFDAELARIDQEIQASTTPALPVYWEVQTDTSKFTISAEPLRSFFHGANGSSPDKAREWIAATRRDLGAFTMSRSAQNSARSDLDEILAREEFRPPPPPSPLQQFWDRVRSRIGAWLDSLFEIAAQHPNETRILFWLFIAGVLTALSWWLWKHTQTENMDLRLPTPPKEVILQTWQEWMQAARAAAARGEYREAIHDGYWAGIARLQLERTIHINLTDTPRERLRSVTASTRRFQPLPASELKSLTAVTSSFERVWYADLPATAEDVERAFADLETLGCKAA
jgi:hypothetical protein